MEYKESTVHRKLDAKIKIGGMEAPDILAILIFASVMNLFFGRTSFSFIFVIVLPAILLCILYFGKRGKPDDYLIHVLRFYLSKGFFAAGENESNQEKILGVRIYDKSN
ncbi:MAG: hypothetical protein JNM24_12425 [Bdellovibrionaceae bacterium]|jgi:hypothetical protein|nr:hypothetical protein [Pseudobdellovibrionaceae bacterium]